MEFKLEVGVDHIDFNKLEGLDESCNQMSPASGVVPLPHAKKCKYGALHLSKMLSEQEPYHMCRNPGRTKLSKTKCLECKMFLCLNSSHNCLTEFHK